MSTALVTLPAASSGTRPDPVGELLRREPLLAGAGFFFLALMLPTAVAFLADERLFAGVNVWEKPLKFEFAIGIYLMSLAFFAHWLPAGTRAKRWYRVYVMAIVVGFFAEMAWIGLAATLGTASHFNASNAGWQIAYAAAGIVAVMATLASPVFAFQIWRNPATGLSPAVKASIVQGLVVTGVMTIVVAGTMSSYGSHLVGGNMSDTEGFPLMGWARDGGDLRVAHFFATHAMHFLPLFGLASAMLLGREKTGPVWLFAIGLVALTLFTFVQALRGMPFLPGIG